MKRLCSFLLVAALISGCSGITPREYRNHREEGPHNGLLSGPRGAYEIRIPDSITQQD